MEMDATGVSRGDWIFQGEFDQTTAYLSDQKKILGFNPFCHSVELTSTENVYKWLFRVTDPQSNPFDIIFFVEQSEELLIELPENVECSNPDELSEEMIKLYTIGKKVQWKHYPVASRIEDPEKYLFEGKAFADMYMHPVEENKTRVQFDLKIDVRFILYPAFRIIPEKILHAMTNAGMSMIMQTATNKMFHSITKDFESIRQV
ncbi:DUF1997 domain-containing protein [Pelodictyon phaeoclathratiforme]|jgi:hypothetical protein|uniref:DUF1997 domain-containing protein n=1 Tax=Pelodictyon phaeoclathratiforme (strain DSM 5477 / BU-1) TaxID=324925 RepID=B4SAR4_PELPB|nr:DUF1997 domain-containing protein [Pelodictyon phaeoclathratiforme]ACF42433.1 conserved hypothetical protein [Pelodictyon phaeoclathratiforme BU-1]MBV5288862.1 DUF1997 domain-containing protein [Pelodictyon phaeoclathratiforme]